MIRKVLNLSTADTMINVLSFEKYRRVQNPAQTVKAKLY